MATVTYPVHVVDSDQNIYGKELKTKVAALQKEVGLSFGNFHANLFNSGKDDDSQMKPDRMAAMKRRMAKGF